ncbi:MAG: hypothetical protein ACEPO2_16405 [Pelagibaca sp.]
MTSLLRHLTSLGLALLIAFTSVQFAAARGQSPAVGTMEICTGTGPIHILVDENGEPTGGVMICPDYAMAFYADVLSAVPDLQQVALWQDIWLPSVAVGAHSAAPRAAQARGPPGFV